MLHKAILVTAPGGPENLKWKEVPIPVPGEGEVLIHHKAVGLNYIDIYHRNGTYALPEYPAIPGIEAVGVVEKTGPNTSLYKVGDRVAYALGPMGAYCQFRTIHERRLVPLPDPISFEIAAASLMKGLTAHFLVRRTFQVNEKHTILVHAAAGGVGLLLCQWAKHLGARVIGTVSTEEKAAIAKAHGCDFPILYKKENVAARVMEITEGQGVNVVYDSVGKDTLTVSLQSVMKFGLLVSYGQSSGAIENLHPKLLQEAGSIFFTRPSVLDYKSDYEEYVNSVVEVFDLILRGVLQINVGQSYYLSDAASAHRDLEAGRTIGSTILVTA